MNNFQNELLLALSSKLSQDDLHTVIEEFEKISINYDIAQKERNVILYESDINYYVDMCLANMKYQGLADGTIKDYGYYLKLFSKRVNKNVNLISPIEIKLFVGEMQQRNNTTINTSNNVVKSLRKFFKFLVQNDIIDKNPMDKVETRKGEKVSRKAMTRENLEELREACRTDVEKLLIEVMYSTGARINEIVNIEINDIDINSKKIKVIGKGNKEGYLRLNARSLILVEKSIKERQRRYLFESRLKCKYTTNGLRKVLNNIYARTNISLKVTPHILRHTTATLAIEAGMPILEVKELLRHENLDTTSRYIDVVTTTLDNDHRRFVV